MYFHQTNLGEKCLRISRVWPEVVLVPSCSIAVRRCLQERAGRGRYGKVRSIRLRKFCSLENGGGAAGVRVGDVRYQKGGGVIWAQAEASLSTRKLWKRTSWAAAASIQAKSMVSVSHGVGRSGLPQSRWGFLEC